MPQVVSESKEKSMSLGQLLQLTPIRRHNALSKPKMISCARLTQPGYHHTEVGVPSQSDKGARPRSSQGMSGRSPELGAAACLSPRADVTQYCPQM